MVEVEPFWKQADLSLNMNVIYIFTLHFKADSVYFYTVMYKCVSSLGLLASYGSYC